MERFVDRYYSNRLKELNKKVFGLDLTCISIDL